jgi:hypothetical protein
MRADTWRRPTGQYAGAMGDFFVRTANGRPAMAPRPYEGADPIVDYRGDWYSTNRSGCFLDENGTANVRVTCGDGIYIGVLGRDADVSMLYEWTIQYPPSVMPGQDLIPPGICVNSDRISASGAAMTSSRERALG